MSHPVFTPGPTFEVPKPDCPLESSGSFNFSAGSSSAAGFSKTCTEKPHISSRSRPRLTKVRRRQTVKTDLGMNGVSDVRGEKDGNLGNVAGDNSQNSGSNRSANLNGNMEQLGSGLVFGGSLNDPIFGSGSGNGKPLFSSQLKEKDCSFTFNKVSPNFDVHKETGSFVFGAHKDGSVLKQNLPGDANSGCVQFVFGAGEKDSGGNFGQPKVSELKKPNNTQFLFVSDSNGVNVDKSEGDKVFRSTIPDMRGKAEKVCNSCSHFPCTCNKYHGNCKFGIDLENKSTGKVSYMPDFRDSGKENVGVSSENTGLNGVFVFGGLKGKGSLKSCGCSKPFSEMKQLNRGKADDSNGFGQHNQNSGSDINSNFQDSGSLGDSFETGPVSDILNKMSRLNIGDSVADAKKIFSGNSLDTDNVFVFRGVQKTSDFIEDCHPNKSHKTSDVRQSDRTSSSFFPSAGVDVMGNDGFCEVLFMNKDEKDSSFRCKLDGLNSSNADGSTPNMKFDFSKNNLFPCIDKLDNTNLRSLGSKKSKKKNGKLRQRTVVQQLFSQNHVSKEGNPEQIQKSPGCGSPMDFSPYRDTSARNAPDSNTETGVKGELPGNEKNTSAHCEKPHDDRSTSSFPPLPAQDGLTNIRLQYKKKYKLKVGSNPTARRNSPDKENAKQEPSGATTLEVCEHWRIRGNEAYHAGQHSKAEEFYSMGIKSVQHVNVLEYSIKPLLLCYSNRAATRMSLGRMREAIGDCTKASELDPNFLRATLRAGNCYLVLGEVDDAIECYTKCSSDGTSICLDRKLTIEAADGLQKAKKVAEHILQCAKILKEGTEDAAKRALGIIEEALSISRYSERLLEMKGEALHMLRMYDEVIQLCERTLDVAEKNFSADRLYNPKCKTSHVKLWRWHLQTKSYYRLGKLELALDLIEKQEKMPISSMSGDVTQESSVSLAANIRELISLKKSGNEAFISGKDTEATEHYTAAISKSFESRGFMAICFCNRAAAYQSLGQIVDAISDCSVAIALDENYTKAISRRATLHELIRDYKQAACDLERVVSLLESQSQTKTQGKSSGGGSRELRKARHRLSSAEEKAKKETPLDLYLILGIKASDSESEIKKAYRKAALRHHPDKAGQVLARNDVADDGTLRKEFGEKIHNDADRLFKIIGEAYAVLSDPSKRSKYDDEEEMRKIYRDSARNGNSCHPSTSYSSPFERGSSSGRQSGSYERRRYWQWHDTTSYSYSHSRS